MQLLIQFPKEIIDSYFGVSNLDITLDDNISYLIGKYFFDNKIDFKILKLEFITSKIGEKLVQYKIEIDVHESKFQDEWIYNELKKEGFEKGLIIKI